MTERKKLSLMDTLAEAAGLIYLSDIKDIVGKQRRKVIQTLRDLTPEDYPMSQWDDALQYLASAPPQPTAEASRQWLVEYYCKLEGIPLLRFSRRNRV